MGVVNPRGIVMDECIKNEDYQELLQVLATLEAQKAQAIKDLEALEELQAKAEKSSLEVYKAIARDQETPGGIFPPKQIVATVPEVDWSKYNIQFASNNYNTRHNRNGSGHMTNEADHVTAGIELSTKPGKKKSSSYGQPWTIEEQRRLEDLLRIYPSEEVESKRWLKIANALGNRTTKQVCCRVQKYFIRLAKAGLPVPGRMPNLATYTKKSSRLHRSTTRQPSLFFSSLKPKVYMSSSMQGEQYDSTSSCSSSDTESDHTDTIVHNGVTPLPPLALPPVTCSGCGHTLHSVYWQCTDCSVLLCLTCVKSNWSSTAHLPSHDMVECLTNTSCPVPTHSTTDPYIDNDYTAFQQATSLANYNYLDPNFCPAL